MTPTIHELRERRNQDQLEALQRCFDLPARAREVDISMSNAVKETLGPQKLSAARAAEQESWAAIERANARAAYEDATQTYQRLLEARREEVERALFGARETSPELLLGVASASPEALDTMLNMALRSGDTGAARVVFHAAHERDLEVLAARYAEAVPEAGRLYDELAEIEAETTLSDDEIADHFERLAAAAPGRGDLLVADGSGFPHGAA